MRINDLDDAVNQIVINKHHGAINHGESSTFKLLIFIFVVINSKI